MRRRAIWLAPLISGAGLVAGCAVGRFIAGAPARGGPPASSGSPAQGPLARRCAGCHEAPDPAAMSGAAWQAALERMRLRIRLPQSEWDSLAAMARSGANADSAARR